MYIDWTYMILVLPAVLFTMWASANVKSTYNRYSRQQNSRGMTGAQAARRVLDANGLQNVAIQQIDGELTDHYDPKANMIRLSADVYNSTSTAAIGVACHEVGHAIQYAQDYVPVKIRSAIIPVTNFGSKLSWPLVLAGLLLCSVAPDFIYLAYIGVACFALCAVFQLVTLPCFATAIMYAGAISFFVSDSILFYVRFRKGRPFKTHFGVMLTYLLAEFLIVSGFILLAA